jgi:PAS domain S-box-containing protein
MRGASQPSPMKATPFRHLRRALEAADDSERVLSHLLHLAADDLGGRASVLLEAGQRHEGRIATAGFGLPVPPASELALADARRVEAAVARADPARFDDLAQEAPSLAILLGTPAAVVARVSQAEPAPLIAVGFAASETPDPAALRSAIASFEVGLEWLRLRRARALQREVQNLVHGFSQGLSAMPDLSGAFERACLGAGPLFGARRATIWIHDRRGRQLELRGSSERRRRRPFRRVASDDFRESAARGLRLERPEFAAEPEGTVDYRTLLVPLRGRRRALGTLVLEGLQGPSSERAILIEAAGEFGRQLSTAIENIDLLAQLLRSRQELENTFNSLVDLVAVCDRRGRVVQVNESLARRLGGTTRAFSDRPLRELVGPGVARFVAERESEVSPLQASSQQIEDPKLGGTFFVSVAALVNHDGERVGTVVVARDVTDQVRLEAERTALRQQLAQSEKLAALGQFVAGIAHELNNPLQGVLGHLDLLPGASDLTAPQRRTLRTIQREAERAARIVRNLLVFAGSGRRLERRYSVNAVVDRALAQRLRALGRAGVTVVKTLDARIPRLVGSPLLLQQSLVDLLINAEQAMSGSPGRLSVTTRLSKGGERATIEVRDTGPGLSEEVQRRLFEPFFTTKEVGQGTGLGLALTYGVVHGHGGTITARNHPEGGAIFTIELPTDRMVIE